MLFFFIKKTSRWNKKRKLVLEGQIDTRRHIDKTELEQRVLELEGQIKMEEMCF